MESSKTIKGFGIIGLLIVVVAIAVGVAYMFGGNNILQNVTNVSMIISSSAFENGAPIPKKYTCDGENINPPISISGVPAGTKSLVLLFDDPDAPGATWVHWIVWNIDSALVDVPEGTVPHKGIEGKTSFGTLGYGGPCPPAGTHRYFFKLYALDTILNIPLTSEISTVEKTIAEHMLADARLMGTYTRD